MPWRGPHLCRLLWPFRSKRRFATPTFASFAGRGILEREKALGQGESFVKQKATLHHRVLALAERELEHRVLTEEALGLLRGYLETRMLLWLTLDPVTLLPTSLHLPRFLFGLEGFVSTAFYFKQFASFELDPEELLSLSWLVSRGRLCGSVHLETEGEVSRCARFKKVLGRVGIKDEMRVLLNHGGQTWGMIAACRRRSPFSSQEVEVVAGLAPILAAALRRSFLKAALESNATPQRARPGLVLFEEDGEVQHVSPEAEALLGQEQLTLYKSYWLKLLQLREEDDSVASINIMTDKGPVTLHRSLLGGREALIVELSRPSVLAGLLIKAYGLSARESEVVAALCRGWSTRKIAFELDIADYTVQDHLKSIFDKVGVRSRKELVSHLLHNHYLPQHRNGATPSAQGWFLQNEG